MLVWVVFCVNINKDKLCVFVSVQEESTSASETAASLQHRRRDIAQTTGDIEDKVKIHLLEILFFFPIFFNLYLFVFPLFG